jgi:hypothetical protein
MKRIILTTPTPDKPGSRAASTAHSLHISNRVGYGAETSDDDRRDGRVNLVPTVDFQYRDEGDEPAPVVRDAWTNLPVVEKCLRPFAQASGPDAMPMLDKRLEVLRYALREAIESMDIATILRLASKARDTEKRIATEQLAARSPGLRERHGDVVIEDSPTRGRVLIQFAKIPDRDTRRLVRMCGFFGGGDGITWWRKRTFLRGENIALDRARYCVESVLKRRAKAERAERAEVARIAAQPLCA